MTPHHELRRTARIVADLWVAIAGVDSEPELLRGDLSVTGIFIESRGVLGSVGSVQMLTIEPSDRSQSITVMARIVRLVTVDDLELEQTRGGVALEFMPENMDVRRAIEALVEHALKLGSDQTPIQIQHRFDVELEPERDEPRSAIVYQLSVHQMKLETSWPVKIGDAVQVVFRSIGSRTRIPFEGQVTGVKPEAREGQPLYQVDVQLQAPGVRDPSYRQYSATGGSITESVDLIFSDLLSTQAAERKASRREHLVGLLSRIRLPSLLTLFELERSSGEMRVTKGDEKVRLFVREGRIVDVESSQPNASPRDVVGQVIGWSEGTFDFSMQEVQRPDRLGMSTTVLLLDLAQESDEAARDLEFDLV